MNNEQKKTKPYFMLKFSKILLVVLVSCLAFPEVWGQVLSPSSSLVDEKLEQNESVDTSFVDKSEVDDLIWDHLTIISDSRLDTLLFSYRDERNRKGTLSGYKVQIFTGKMGDARQIRENFIVKYPECRVELKFNTPDAYVRVGDCRTRSEAIKLKYSILQDYPDVFIVEDQIGYPPLYEIDKY